MSARCILLNILTEFRKGKGAKISELADSLQISKKECADSLLLVVAQLNDLGYTLLPAYIGRVDGCGKPVPHDASSVEYTHLADSFKKCDFVYLIKTNECTEEDNCFINEHVSEIVYIYNILYLNGSEVEYNRVVSALCRIGESEETLKKIINKKYFYKKKRNDESFVRSGWKFFLEFPRFSSQEYLALLKASCV